MPYNVIIGRNEHDKKIFGEKGLIYIGKGYVKMGEYSSLSNKVFLDVLRSHVILVSGKRGSGKSYSMGVIAEEISSLPKEISQNIAPLIFDTMGIYWTMKFKNEKDRELLDEWDLKAKNLPVKIFVPFAHYEEYLKKGIPVDEKFALDVNEISSNDWTMTFGLEMISPVAILIDRIINKLKKIGKFNILDIISNIKKDKLSEREVKNAAISLFETAMDWGIFSEDSTSSTKVSDLINAGETSVLDLSVYNSVGAFNVRALVISLVSKKIFKERMSSRKKEEVSSISERFEIFSSQEKKPIPLVWLFIDEAHEFLPKVGKTVATDALVQLLREGRQPGISLVLATQQPGQIHQDVMTQSDIVISHKLTSESDLNALNKIMQSYVLEGIKGQMDSLPSLKGSAIVLDDNSERIYPIRVRPRFTWHGGEAPSVINPNKELLD